MIDNLTDTTKAKLDALTKSFHNLHHQKHSKSFPKTNFSSRFTNLKYIRALEWIIILYLLVILSQSKDGWFSIEKALQNGGNENVSDVLYIFGMILRFDVWINQSSCLSTDINDNFLLGKIHQ